MDKQEIANLLVQIKTFYSRFDAVEKVDGRFRVNPATVDSWFRLIGFMDYDRALEILDGYMGSDNGSKTPTAALWVHNGRLQKHSVWSSAKLDLQHGVIVWQPEGGDVYERKIVKEAGGTYEDEEGYLWAFPGE